MKKQLLKDFNIFKSSLSIFALIIFVLLILFGIIVLILEMVLSAQTKNNIFKPDRQPNTSWVCTDPDIKFAVKDAKCFGEYKLLSQTINVIVFFDPGRSENFSVCDYDDMLKNNYEYSDNSHLFSGTCKFYEKKCIVTVTETNIDSINLGDKITFQREIIQSEK